MRVYSKTMPVCRATTRARPRALLHVNTHSLRELGCHYNIMIEPNSQQVQLWTCSSRCRARQQTPLPRPVWHSVGVAAQKSNITFLTFIICELTRQTLENGTERDSISPRVLGHKIRSTTPADVCIYIHKEHTHFMPHRVLNQPVPDVLSLPISYTRPVSTAVPTSRSAWLTHSPGQSISSPLRCTCRSL